MRPLSIRVLMAKNAPIYALSWNTPIMAICFKRFSSARKIKPVSRKMNFGKLLFK